MTRSAGSRREKLFFTCLLPIINWKDIAAARLDVNCSSDPPIFLPVTVRLGMRSKGKVNRMREKWDGIQRIGFSGFFSPLVNRNST
ncbi:hypothetical protein BDR07DRAFT_1402078 [Suillus spraguei]|nr:hypothetical protein BDR07DRAFT_1402078 [Suillus spraguei]